jgi:hypothetical protein
MLIDTYNEITEDGKNCMVASFAAGPETLVKIRQWCYNTYKTPGDVWTDTVHWGKIRFGSNEDLMLVVLTWT